MCQYLRARGKKLKYVLCDPCFKFGMSAKRGGWAKHRGNNHPLGQMIIAVAPQGLVIRGAHDCGRNSRVPFLPCPVIRSHINLDAGFCFVFNYVQLAAVDAVLRALGR